ncbi:MAG: hypothetical protein QG653_77 [Patescibacteria group bacterium]|nr:hypothetical protein [Patescibacteria group bacterium]
MSTSTTGGVTGSTLTWSSIFSPNNSILVFLPGLFMVMAKRGCHPRQAQVSFSELLVVLAIVLVPLSVLA